MNKPKSAKSTKFKITLTVVGALVIVTAYLVTGTDYTEQPYNYKHFSSTHMIESVGPNVQYLKPGQPFPGHHKIYNPETKTWIQVSSLWQDKPLILETGSSTCPIFAGNGVTMDDVYNKYKDRANIALLYVREAHPGEITDYHTSWPDKLKKATTLPVKRPLFVDSIDGSLHNEIGIHPNAAYIIGTDGIISHFALWNDPHTIGPSLERLIEDGSKGSQTKIHHTNACRIPKYFDPVQFISRLAYKSGPRSLRDWFVSTKNYLKGVKQRYNGDKEARKAASQCTASYDSRNLLF